MLSSSLSPQLQGEGEMIFYCLLKKKKGEVRTGETKTQILKQEDVPICWTLLSSKCRPQTHTKCTLCSPFTTSHVHFLKVSRCLFIYKLSQCLISKSPIGRKPSAEPDVLLWGRGSVHKISVPLANWQLPLFAHSCNYFRSLGPSWVDILLSLGKVV